MTPRFRQWLQAYEHAASCESHTAQCPNCGKVMVEYLILSFDQGRTGALFIWCNNCHEGIRFSRLTIRPGERWVDEAAFGKLIATIPQVRYVD